MKLAAQYTRASMLVTVFILLIAGGVYYAAISYMADKQIDRELSEELGEMNEFIEQHQRFPKPYEFDSYRATFEPIGKQEYAAKFVDTLISATGTKSISGRAIIATIGLKGVNYRMTVVASKEVTENLVQVIFLITLLLTALLLVALFLTNRFLLQGIWRPFYHLINRLSTFSFTGRSGTDQQELRIDEFRELQTAIATMERKAGAEYETLKAFTENASHEMVTPVAIIHSKLDNLIQDESLTEQHLSQLQDVYNAGNKLTRLSQSLLLLVKIDHQLIRDQAQLELDVLINEKIIQFAELTNQKSIIPTTRLQLLTINASPYLIDILLNNLLGNAIRHNRHYGQIRIDLDKQHLMIANTGAAHALDQDKIFERFQKSPASEGTGLGLTIAKNICQGYGWTLDYSFDASYHTFIVRFY